MRTIYADLLGQVGFRMRQLMDHPPAGYRFLRRGQWPDKLAHAALRVDPLLQLRRAVNRLIPVNLYLGYGPIRLKKPPRGTHLTYSESALIFRAEPWVIGVEVATQFAGYDHRHLRRYRKLIERSLGSPYCRAVICWSHAARRSIVRALDTTKFEHKLHVVYPAGIPKPVVKPLSLNEGPLRILFVGSVVTPGGFGIKGGREMLEAFVALRQRYPYVELLVRCQFDEELRQKYEALPGLRIVQECVSRDNLEQFYQEADIFWYPAHSLHSVVELEAMSYGLPVVTTDYYDNAEFVEDGRTGMVVRHHGNLPPWDTSPREVREALRVPDPAFVRALVGKTAELIENPELRQRLGRAAREEVEKGKFSLERKNQLLKCIFDRAVGAS